MKIVTIVSGGMDSVTLAYSLAAVGNDQHLVSFNYGQRHGIELAHARLAGQALGVEHTIIDLPITDLIDTSALTDPAIPVPDGHYAEDTMRATVVPNRNMIMLAVAGAVAVAERAQAVAIGVHGGDHFIYPDCRPEFIEAAHAALVVGNEGFLAPNFRILAPFLDRTKADIVTIGDGLGVPWADTWSCYKGGAVHCGACGTCFERREAFKLAGVTDPTRYEATPDYAAPR